MGGGYFVIAIARKLPDFNHPNALCLSCDVTKPDDIKKAVELGIQKFGKIDVLCNNAGKSAGLVIEDETLEHMKDVMEVNFWGTFNTIRALIPHFRKNKNGTVINNTSMSGLVSRYAGSAYNSSKFAIEGLSGALRNDTQKFCRVMTFELGWFANTNIAKNSLSKKPDFDDYISLKDIYGYPPYKLQNNLEIAVSNIINEAENAEMHHRLMLGDDCLFRVASEMKIRNDDWLYSNFVIPSCTKKLIPSPDKKLISYSDKKLITQNNKNIFNFKNFVQQIFSVKNHRSINNVKHKVITVFGLKFKFAVRKT